MKRVVSPLLKLVALGAVLAFAFWFWRFTLHNQGVQDIISQYGYLGVFIASIIGGINIIVPIPIISFIHSFLASGLNIWFTIVVITAGETIGDTVGYFIGLSGKQLLMHRFEKEIAWLERIRERYHWAPLTLLFCFAVVAPLPNELLIIPLGFMGYHLIHILPIIFAGNLIFNFLSAHGVINLFEYLNAHLPFL